MILSERGRIYNFYIIDDANIDVNGCVLHRNNAGSKLNKMLKVFLPR